MQRASEFSIARKQYSSLIYNIHNGSLQPETLKLQKLGTDGLLDPAFHRFSNDQRPYVCWGRCLYD